MIMMRTSALTVSVSGTLYRNGSGSTASGTWNGTSGNGETILVGASNRHFYTGYMAELYWFTTQLSTSQSNILAVNAGTFYNLPWTGL